MRKSVFIIITIILLSIGGIIWFGYAEGGIQSASKPKQQKVTAAKNTWIVNNKTIGLELADTAAKREKGLSGRASLGEDQAMLFVFDVAQQWGFWMKDMQFALDMIWLDPDLKVVDITRNARPESYPDSFAPRVPAKYVLEVNAGFTDANKIKIGDIMNLSY